MADLDWELWVHDLVTGAPIERVDPRGSTWSTGIYADGTSTEVFHVDNDVDGLGQSGAFEDLFRGNERMLVRWWDDFPMYAQKIDDWVYDVDSGIGTVSTVDLVNETEWRLIGPVDAPAGTTLEVSNVNAAGAVHEVLRVMMAPGPGWYLPIDLPAGAGAGGFSGRWEFWRKLRISDILDEIRKSQGVEIYLRPYNAGDRTVRFETLVSPRIRIGETLLHLQAEQSPLSGTKYRKSFKKQLTGLLGVGNGTGVDQETRTAKRGAGDIDAIIIRDAKESFDGLTGDALQGATTNHLEANKKPVAQWSIDAFTISDDWAASDVAVGRGWRVESHGNPVIPDGEHPLRVLRASGGSGHQVKVEIQDG